MLHNVLLVYTVRWKVGWNILPNATYSHQSETVKFSRHQSPTDCRLHQFPDSYVVKFQVHLFTKPAPSSIYFKRCFCCWRQSSIPGESYVWVTCLTSKRNLIHMFKTYFTRKQGTEQWVPATFLYRSPKADVFIFHFNIKKQEKEKKN